MPKAGDDDDDDDDDAANYFGMAETESWKLEPLNSLASSNRHVF
jgi:hypothetical protein